MTMLQDEARRRFSEPSGEQETRAVVVPDSAPQGAMALRGFARRFRSVRRSRDWMMELREGEV